MSFADFHFNSGLSSINIVLLLSFTAGATFIHFIIEPIRWQLAYLPDEVSSDTKNKVRDILYCTAMGTYLLPFKLGLPLRIAMLRNKAQLGLSYISAILALDGLVSLFIWLASVSVLVWIAAIHWRPPGYLLGAGLSIACLFIVIFGLRQRIKIKFSVRWREFQISIDRPWRRAIRASALILLDVSSYWLRHVLLVMIVTGSPKYALIGGASGVISTFAGIISGLPMGLLGYDATLVALLSAAGLDVSQAVAIIAINRSLNIAMALILGIPASARLGFGTGLSGVLRKLREIGNDNT